MGLLELEKELLKELQLLEYPPIPWLDSSKEGILDVAIIGGGMAGLATAFALMREGISNIRIFDSSAPGLEGPWKTYARMRTLRSEKNLVGPALYIPKLTFQAWYSAIYGEEAWYALYKIPTDLWMNYLCWYCHVLKIPVINNKTVTLISPADDLIQLSFKNEKDVLVRKVVLATGRSGFGGPKLPSFVMNLPKTAYAHTNDNIDFAGLQGKHLCIIGVGASAFDAAAMALEHGVKTVTLLLRRKSIPNINKFASTTYPGFSEGFCELSDKYKVLFIEHGAEAGSPPPFESLDRIKKFSNFKILEETEIQNIVMNEQTLVLTTSRGILRYDFLILATGYAIDGNREPTLAAIFDNILLWKDRLPDISKKYGAFPYLGSHFQFLEKTTGCAQYLKDIYCFNYAATLSHGIVSSDIPDISTGAIRLAKGVTADFFTQGAQSYYHRLQAYLKEEFLEKDYPFLCL